MRLTAAAGSVAAAALMLVLVAGGAAADGFVAAGQRAKSPTTFVVVGEEVFAPLLPVLKHLGARYEVTPEAIKITAASRAEVVISRERAEATRDGVLRELPGAPRSKGREILLPARAVGSLLGCAVRWDEPSRTLYFHPWVRRFSLDRLPDRLRLTVGAEGPIAYRTGQLDDPPRLYVDLLNVDLADIPSEVLAEQGYFRAARIHQNTLAPEPAGDVTRVVVELSEWRPYRIRASEDRCRLEMDFPLPEQEELPPDGPRVALSGMSFRRMSSKLAEVRLAVTGKAACTSGAAEDPPEVWVEVANAENRMTTPTLEVQDKLVSGASVAPSPDKPGVQRLTIALSEATGHAVVSEQGQVRVLLGRLELAGARIAIDAGHGGNDTGAIGRTGMEERTVNLEIALQVERLLKGMGATVLMTRVDNRALRPWARGDRQGNRQDLLARCALANDAGADLFVSIHANARETNPMSVRGTETYIRKPDSKAFAEVMQEQVVRALGLPDGGVKFHPKSIIVLYQTNMPAVMVEVGYLSHPEDEAELASTAARQRAAMGIANGIRRYVEEGGLLVQFARRVEAEGRRPERPASPDGGPEPAPER